ncbi:MAG TPA: hypothetical protein VGK34_04790 [Armatimonadota bacterium]
MKTPDHLIYFFFEHFETGRASDYAGFSDVFYIIPTNRANACWDIFAPCWGIRYYEGIWQVGQQQSAVAAEDPFEVSGTATTKVLHRAPAGTGCAVDLNFRQFSTRVARQLHVSDTKCAMSNA